MNADSIETLVSQIHGSVILPGQADYDAGRRVCNSMHDRRPKMIVLTCWCGDGGRDEATAFANRHTDFSTVIGGTWPERAAQPVRGVGSAKEQ